ncbi:hypothetical protein BLA29_006529, partial [Euroglyphus maynei]
MAKPPRTSAEFEQLFLMQQNNSPKTNTVITNKPFKPLAKLEKSSLTSVQLSTITHLTSLAKNIRFANMTQLQNNHNLSTMANNTHSKSKFDPIL